MVSYLIRRFLYMIILLLVLSFVSFVIIQLPPGDYVSSLIEAMELRGLEVDQVSIEAMRVRYGLDLPFYRQYLRWFGTILRGDFGRSFQYDRPVLELIGERLPLTVVISVMTLVLTYAIAIPVGIYSATHQYSVGDYVATFFGFLGLAVPNFLLALVLMYLSYKYLGWSVAGLFSPEYQRAAWSFGKFVDMLKHLPVPLIVVGTAGTAGLIRVMRATLLDELKKQYVITARAKGVAERTLLARYPVRVAMNPLVSRIGGIFPEIISGATLTAIVLSLPMVGPMLLSALQAQDMYFAGSLVMILGALGIFGNVVADVLLVVVDPRIRFEKKQGQ